MPERGRQTSPADQKRWLIRWLRSRRVVVRDASMTPGLRPGDKLLVDPTTFRGRPPRLGEVVVLVDPEDRRRKLIKRLAALPGEAIPFPPVPGDDTTVPGGRVYVLSDRREGTRDSRRFGPVLISDLVGPAWYRYGPQGRRGPLSGSTP